MAETKKIKIAVSIQSEVQYFSLGPLLKELARRRYSIYIIGDFHENNVDGYREMAARTRRLLIKEGFQPLDLSSVAHIMFDLCLTPYIDERIKAERFMKYEYGTLNIKPNPTYMPIFMEKFHAFLCQSTVTRQLLSAYGKTFAVDNLRFYNKRRIVTKQPKSKPVVLFAPTYNDKNSIEKVSKTIKELKKNYYVIAKGHHGVEYLKANVALKSALQDIADEYYGSDTELADLIMRADVCLFDNSSAIAEALYAGTPCAIITDDLDYFKLGDIHTSQYEFVKNGIIPYTNKISDVIKTIRIAMSDKYITRQQKLSKEIFSQEFKTGIKGYVEAIEYMLYDQVAQDYIKLHNYIINEKEQKDKKYERCNKELETCKGLVVRQNEMLGQYAEGKLYKLASKIYKIEGRIRNVKN